MSVRTEAMADETGRCRKLRMGSGGRFGAWDYGGFD